MAKTRWSGALAAAVFTLVAAACTTRSVEDEGDTLAVVDSPVSAPPASPNVGTPPAEQPAAGDPQRQPPASAPPRTPSEASGVVTPEELAQMKAQARELARHEGCPAEGRCATAPIGAKPCGGPQAYLVYCSATTDTVALFGLLERIREAERALNERTGRISDCMLVTPPEVELVGGACRAAGGTR